MEAIMALHAEIDALSKQHLDLIKQANAVVDLMHAKHAEIAVAQAALNAAAKK